MFRFQTCFVAEGAVLTSGLFEVDADHHSVDSGRGSELRKIFLLLRR
jgi:hypothetical protein